MDKEEGGDYMGCSMKVSLPEEGDEDGPASLHPRHVGSHAFSLGDNDMTEVCSLKLIKS